MLKSQAPLLPAALEIKRRAKNRSPANRTCTPTAHKRSASRASRTYAFCQPSPTPARARTRSIDQTRQGGSTPHHRRQTKSTLYSSFSDDRDELVEKAKLLISKCEYKSAIQCLREALIVNKNNLDALYSRAVCYMHLNEHKLALPDLLAVVRENPLYDKQLHVALAMCSVALKDTVTAVRHLSRGLQKFPKFAEGYVIRGQLYNQLQRWDKAISDFRRAIHVNPKEGGAFIGLADSLVGVGDSATALKVLAQATACPDTRVPALLKQGKVHYRLGNYKGALEDLDNYLVHQSEDAEAYYLKSLVLISLKQFADALLSLEQTVKHDRQQTYIGNAIYHLGALKVRERDFYGALHTFKRVPTKLQVPEQAVLTLYAEAVINLMKRSYKEGVQAFSKLIKKNHSCIQEYIGNCYAFRGYGYSALGSVEKALKDFKAAKAHRALDKASKFNQTMCRGLLQLHRKDPDSALKFFGRALLQFPRNPDPVVYHAAVLIEKAYANEQPVQSCLEEAHDLMTKAVQMRDSECEVFFFRAIVRYLLNQPEDTLEDIKQAIEKAEDNMAEHYVIRGLAHAALQDFQEALQDFSIAIQLKDSLQDAYYYRARCAYLLDDTTVAYNDFQKLIELNSQDVQAHVQAGNLLMLAGSYEDALKAYGNALNLEHTAEVLFLRAKTYILMADLEAARNELSQALTKQPSAAWVSDKEILSIVMRLMKDHDFSWAVGALSKWVDCPGEMFEPKHILWFKGIAFLYLNEHDKALKLFQTVLEIIHSHDPADMNSDEALTAEEENCEILYNIALCHLPKNKSHALLILQDLSEVLNSKHRGQMLFISGLIELALSNNARAEKLIKDAAKCDPESLAPFFEQQPTTLLPLNTSNEFSSNFPLLPLPMEPRVSVRPAMSLPRVKPPSFDFRIEHRAREYFTVKTVAPKPEAPWLNRVRGSIQFTEAIFDVESEQSEESVLERANDRGSDEELEEEDKRLIKSAVALCRYSSGSIDRTSYVEPDNMEAEEIISRIKAICQ